MKTDKLHKYILVFLFTGIIILLPVLTFITMPKEERPFSENENRYLTAFPTVSFDNYLDEDLMTGIEDWFSDRFFGRESWIQAKNSIERLIGKTDINGIYTADGKMMQIWGGYDEEFIGKNLTAINNFATNNPDLPVYFVLAPTSQEIYKETFPVGAPIGSQSELFEYCSGKLTDCTSINVFDSLKAKSDEYIYYRTDHHWTSLGAYIAYYDIAETLGFKPFELSDFDIEHASTDFLGTLYSKTLDSGITPDIIDYYHITDSDYSVKLTISDGTETKTYDSLYFRDYLSVKDKYSSFLGTNSPLMTIETNVEGPSVVIFKDSYAHSLIPFLANHYSKITVLDMRYIQVSYNNLIDTEEYDSAIVLYNAITFSEDANIRKLNLK